MNEVIVTLTTLPERLFSNWGDAGIKACLKSLNEQTYDGYEIHFNIPYVHKLSGVQYTLPEWIDYYDKINIFRTEDMGPATKLIPTVERVYNQDAVIIVVDDDLVYHSDMVGTQVENQKKWKESIVGYDGLRSRSNDGSFSNVFGDSRDYYFTSQNFHSKVDILQHYKSVSYKRGYFEEDFFDFVKNNHSWSDDLLMAAYFSYKKRDRIVETHESIPTMNTREDWEKNGGVTTFPILRHTHHGSYEGCNIYRQEGLEDNSANLFKLIDKGYTV